MAALDRSGSVRVWAAARSLSRPATIPEIQGLAGASHQTASRRLRYWAQLGHFVERPEQPSRYAIARASRKLAEAPTGGELSAAAWSALRRAGKPMTLRQLVDATGSSDRAVYCRIHRWLQLGCLVRLPAEPAQFLMTDEARLILEPPLPTPPTSKPRKIPTMRGRLWAVMRVLKEFDVPLLVMTAEVNRRASEDFISVLGRAGYVRTVSHHMRRHKAGNNGFARDFTTYRLIRSTGPKAPIVSCPQGGGRRLIDPNTGESIALTSRRGKRAPVAAGVNHER